MPCVTASSACEGWMCRCRFNTGNVSKAECVCGGREGQERQQEKLVSPVLIPDPDFDTCVSGAQRVTEKCRSMWFLAIKMIS